MGLLNWLEGNLEKMHWHDITLIKWAVLFWTLFLVTAWEGFRNLAFDMGWEWHFGIAVALTLILVNKIFFKNHLPRSKRR